MCWGEDRQVLQMTPAFLLGQLGLWSDIPKGHRSKVWSVWEMVNLRSLWDVQEEKSDNQLDIEVWSLREKTKLKM